MAASRRSPPADAAGDDPVARVRNAVADALTAQVRPGASIAVALSGGRDSMALLECCAHWARELRRPVQAIHVHHGLSPEADAWVTFCERAAAARNVPLLVRKVTIPPRPANGIEATARAERYRAIVEAANSARIDTVLLAHHQDDQAETLLLQLGRGAGPHGLAAMPAVTEVDGIRWLRPLIDVPRSAIDAFVEAVRLPFVDDASNADPRHRRNAVRTRLAPMLVEVFPGYPGTLARAARLQAEAAMLADELAAQDASGAYAEGALGRARLASLPDHRARNLLRWFLRQHGLRPPSAAGLSSMLHQFTASAADARVRVTHEGAEIGVYRDRIVVHDAPPPAFELPWRGEASLALPHGRLDFVRGRGDGVSLSRIADRRVIVRRRQGGERLALAANRPRRALKRLLQEAGLAPWDRFALPLVFCDDVLIAVPGIGVDARWHAEPGCESVRPVWRAGQGEGGSCGR